MILILKTQHVQTFVHFLCYL